MSLRGGIRILRELGRDRAEMRRPPVGRAPAWPFAAGVALSTIAACLVSCATVEQRPGVTVVNGAYQRYFEASPEAVLDAAMAGYKEMGLLVQGRGAGGATARTAQGVVVETRAVAEGRLTRARVLVTPGHDETLSTAILDGIGARLDAR